MIVSQVLMPAALALVTNTVHRSRVTLESYRQHVDALTSHSRVMGRHLGFGITSVSEFDEDITMLAPAFLY